LQDAKDVSADDIDDAFKGTYGEEADESLRDVALCEYAPYDKLALLWMISG